MKRDYSPLKPTIAFPGQSHDLLLAQDHCFLAIVRHKGAIQFKLRPKKMGVRKRFITRQAIDYDDESDFSEDRSRATPTWLLSIAIPVTLSAHIILYLSIELCDIKKRGKYLAPGYHERR